MTQPETPDSDLAELRETVIREIEATEQSLAQLYTADPNLATDLNHEWLAALMVSEAPELHPADGPTPDLITAFRRLRSRLEAAR